MTTHVHTAVLLDLHSSSSTSCSISNHTDLVKNKINTLFNDGQTSCDVIQLYVLTSSKNHVIKAVDDLTASKGEICITVVEAGDRIASFYSAKQKLDSLDITKVRLVCDAAAQTFWTHVCELLFTPVHDWNVEAVISPDEQSEVNSHLSPANTEAEKPTTELFRDATEENHHHHLYHYHHHHHQATDPESILSSTHTKNHNSGHSPHLDDASSSIDFEISDCTSDSVRTRIQRFLQTLPSLLGLPEVDRSSLLPGRGSGFVHGYSTRRGGVTLLPTLCAMNVLYTDKKRESRLVVDENKRRLALAGGFDPDNYHIVKVEHGHRVWTVGEEQPPKYDALITNRRDVTIAAAGADCIPLLFADPVAMVIGAAHAGWLGTVEKVAECVVRAMGEKFGSRPEDIRVSMGPGLRLGCFKVLLEEGEMFASIHPSCQADSVEPFCHKIDKTGVKKEEARSLKGSGKSLQDEDVQNQVHETFNGEMMKGSIAADVRDQKMADRLVKTPDAKEKNGETTSVHTEARDNDHVSDTDTTTSVSRNPLQDFKVQLIPEDQLLSKTHPKRNRSSRPWTFVDLQMTNYHVLLQAGVRSEHIDMSTSHCTKCNPDLYFSYERDGFPFGNQIGFICMPSDDSV